MGVKSGVATPKPQPIANSSAYSERNILREIAPVNVEKLIILVVPTGEITYAGKTISRGPEDCALGFLGGTRPERIYTAR